MIQWSLVAVSIVLIGLRFKRLTARVSAPFRPVELLPPERVRALLNHLRRQHRAHVET
jgi:hypothetical protein